MGGRGAESRIADKDSCVNLNASAERSDDRAVIPEPVQIAQVQLPDVRDALDRHDDSLEPEPPGEDGRPQAERAGDFRPEDAAPAEFEPSAVGQLTLRLHARLRVREIAGPELHPREAEPAVEFLNHADELREVRALLHDDALDLVELGQVLPVDRVGPEVAADDKRLLRRVRMLGQPPQRDRRRVRSEHRALRLLPVPRVPPSRAPGVAPGLVDLRDAAHEVLAREGARRRRREVERVELVSRGVVLRLEERVEVPERRLDEIALDLREAHAQEDPTDLLDVRAEDVPLPRPDEGSEGSGVVPPEL